MLVHLFQGGGNVPARPRILVIDDDETVADLITDILTGSGCDVTAIYKSHEGLEELQQGQYDLLILDLGMPEMEGCEVVERVRQDLGLDQLPIVIVSAFPELRRRVPDDQVSGFLGKPFTVNQLIDMVAHILHEQTRETNSVPSD